MTRLKVEALILFSFMTLCAIAAVVIPDDLDRAIDRREEIDLPSGNRPYGFDREWLRKIRHKNERERLKKAPTIGLITDATVVTTIDSKETVIKLQTIDGAYWSLWLTADITNKDNKDTPFIVRVRAITDY